MQTWSRMGGGDFEVKGAISHPSIHLSQITASDLEVSQEREGNQLMPPGQIAPLFKTLANLGQELYSHSTLSQPPPILWARGTDSMKRGFFPTDWRERGFAHCLHPVRAQMGLCSFARPGFLACQRDQCCSAAQGLGTPTLKSNPVHFALAQPIGQIEPGKIHKSKKLF